MYTDRPLSEKLVRGEGGRGEVHNYESLCSMHPHQSRVDIIKNI